MEYISSTDTIIISPEFNKELTNEHIEIISKFNKVIFSDFKLNDKLFKVYTSYKLFEAYENDKFNGLKYVGNYFNKPVNNLPNSLTHLVFGKSFNLPVDNLPCSLTHLTLVHHSINL